MFAWLCLWKYDWCFRKVVFWKRDSLISGKSRLLKDYIPGWLINIPVQWSIWVWDKKTIKSSWYTLTNTTLVYMGPKIGVPQNGWSIMESPIKIHDVGVLPFSETPICRDLFFGGGGVAVFLGGRKFRVPCCGPRGLLTGPQHCDLAVFVEPGGNNEGGGSNNPKRKHQKLVIFGKKSFWYRFFAQVWWLFLSLTHMFVERLSYSYRMSVFLYFFRYFGIFQVNGVDKINEKLQSSGQDPKGEIRWLENQLTWIDDWWFVW